MDSLPADLASRFSPLAIGKTGALVGRVRRWSAARIPELVVVTFGVLLRCSLSRWYDVRLGYDYDTHHQYLRYLVDHHRLPPFDLNVASYHPPLFYALGALGEGAGLTPQAVGWVSIVSACLQLLLLWLGLEIYLRRSRLARVLALATATVVPAAVHVAGMVSNEALSDLFCTGATVLLPQVFWRRGRAAVVYAAAAGGCLGLALLTKISGAMVVAAFLAGMTIALVRARRRGQLSNSLQATAVLLVVTALIGAGPYIRLRVLHGSWVLTGYDQWAKFDGMQKIPYLRRRPPAFLLYWDASMYRRPYPPSATGRFWPMVVTSTFSDYYNYAFVPRPGPNTPVFKANGKSLRRSALWPSRASVVGGSALALLTAVAWLISARTLWRGKDYGRLVILLIGLGAVVGQLHFSVNHPYDGFGPIKGAYMQFAGPVYCALTGLAIANLWNRPSAFARALGLGGMAAIGLVAIYTIFARVVVPLGS